jgi:hypothetical protein
MKNIIGTKDLPAGQAGKPFTMQKSLEACYFSPNFYFL